MLLKKNLEVVSLLYHAEQCVSPGTPTIKLQIKPYLKLVPLVL